MAVADSPLPPHSSPTDLEAAGVHNAVRHRSVEFQALGALTANPLPKRYYFRRPSRILGISSFRKTAAGGAGAADSTDIDVLVNGTSILSATIQHENADGDDDRLQGVLDAALPAHDGHGYVVAAGDYVEVDIAAIEAGANAPEGLFVELDILEG